MKTNDLIGRLSRLEPPKQVLPSYGKRLLKWSIAGLFCTCVGVAVFGFRSDLHDVAITPGFLIQAALLLIASVLSAFTAFALSVPGTSGRHSGRLVALSLLLWAIFLVVSLIVSRNFVSGVGLFCMRDIFVLGIIPGILLFTMIRAAAPFRSAITGLLTTLSAAGLGALGVQFICKNDNPLHILLWHFIPVLLVGLAGIFLGRVFYQPGSKKNTRLSGCNTMTVKKVLI